MMSPLPTISQAYKLLTQEERHRQLSSHHGGSDENMVFAVSKRRFGDQGDKNRNYNSYNSNSERQNYGNNTRRWSGLYCEHCHMNGHIKHNCYKIVGYPDSYFKKEAATTYNDDDTDAMKSNASFTQEQYEMFVQMMN